jgi:hypothetical protein
LFPNQLPLIDNKGRESFLSHKAPPQVFSVVEVVAAVHLASESEGLVCRRKKFFLSVKNQRGAEKNLHLCRVGAFENPQ